MSRLLPIVVVIAGCIPITEIEFPEVDGIHDTGSCMCAFCWDRPFCFNPEAADPDAMHIPVSAADPCPAGFPRRSEPTTRLRQGDTRSGGIHCIRPEGVDLSFGDLLCPTEEDRRAAVEHIDPCLDLPPCAHRELGVTCPGADETSPDCPEVQLRPVACGVDPPNARDKLIDTCARHGVDVPSAEPGRYCFLNCVDRDCRDFPDGCTECPAGELDPPHVSPFATRIEILPTSRAIVFVDGVGADGVDVVGEAWLNMPGCGPGMTCTASMPYLRLTSTDTSSLDIDDVSATDLRMITLQPIPDGITPATPTASELELDSGAQLYVSADVAGLSGRRGDTFVTRRAVTARIRWDSRTITLNTRLRDDAGTSYIELSLRGQFPNLPPDADAGSDQVLECTGPEGARATLSADGSTDPDGADDITRFSWASVVSGTPRTGFGSTYAPIVPLGDHRFTLNVGDASGAWDIDDVVVSVQDTQAPEIEAELVTDCLWPPAHDMRLFRLGEEIVAMASDVCDAHEPSVRIVSVTSNQPGDSIGDGATEPDVRFGSGAFCVRAERSGAVREPRQYTVVLEASDSEGNVTRESLVITVPHDERRATRCRSDAQPPSVSFDDPSCALEVVEATTAGASASVVSGDAGTTQAADGGGCSAVPSSRAGHAALLLGVCALALALRRRRR